MDTISLKGMSFYGYHGVSPEERRIGQRFYIDVTMILDLSRAGKTDDLKESVNYVDIFQLTKEITEGEPCLLLEHLAYRINQKICENYIKVKEVTTTVHKPEVPIPGILQDVCVSLHQKR